MSFQPTAEEFTITLRDESVPRAQVVDLLLKINARRLTARDLIIERVRAECDNRLFSASGTRAPLVEPNTEEVKLNGPRLFKKDDEESQINRALSGFEGNAFILLLDDRQVETLDEQVELTPETVVTFLRLTPLVGG